MSPAMKAYLALEQAMLELDDVDDPLADGLRDAMDPLWYALSLDERDVLNNRDLFRTEGVHVEPVDAFFVQPEDPSPLREHRELTNVSDWEIPKAA